MATSDPAAAGPTPVGRQDATAIFVNYNSGNRLAPLLDVIEGEVVSIVVVDNASSDGSLEACRGRPLVEVVRNDVNRGFAAAANQGAALADTEWIVICNPDIVLHPGDITKLLSGLPERVAVVAPIQVDEQDRPKVETGGYRASLPRYLLWAVAPVRLHGRWGPWLAPPFPTGDTDLDWVSGALIGIRRRVFRDLGGFDERFFLYHEDVDFGRRAREAGYRVWVRPGLRLFHEVAHGDPERRVLSGLRSVESLALAFPGGWRRRALGLILGMGFGLRATFGTGTAQSLAKAVLPHCRELIAGRMPARTIPS